MNGVRTGMAITQVHRRLTRKAQIQAPVAFVAAVAGTATTTSVGLPVAAGAIRSSGLQPRLSFGSFAGLVAPYPPIPR